MAVGSNSLKPLRLFAIAVALGLTFWALSQPPTRPSSTPGDPARGETPPIASTDSSGPATSGSAPLVEDPPDEARGAKRDDEPPPARETPTWRLRGLALRESDGAGVAGLRVTVSSPLGARSAVTSSLSDALGEFELALPEDDSWRRGQVRLATAIDADSGAQRFQGLVRLDPGLTLLLEDLLVLRGRISTSLRPSDPRLELTFARPTTPATRVRRFVANARTESTGWFEQAARVPRGVDVLRMTVAVDGRVAAFFDVPLAELCSPAGIDVFVELSELRLSVRTSQGAPLAGAEVRVAAFDSERDDFPPVAATDASGVALLRLPAAHYELCVGKPGLCSRVEYFELAPQGGELQLTLESLEAEHEFFGVVVDDAGVPVERAVVALCPSTHIGELSVAGSTSVRTDAHGEFRLRACSTAPLELTAFHREFGLSEPREAIADGSRLVIRLHRTGRLEIDVLTDALPGRFREGPIEYVLAPTQPSELLSGFALAAPIVIDELPAADYELFLTLPGMGACAIGFARVEPGRTSQVVLPAQHASWFEGRVVDAGGRTLDSLDVVARGAWPAHVAELLCWSRTDLTGRFRLLCDRPGAELRVLNDHGDLLAQPANAGEFVELRLP